MFSKIQINTFNNFLNLKQNAKRTIQLKFLLPKETIESIESIGGWYRQRELQQNAVHWV